MLAQVGHDKDLKPETLNFELHEVKADKQPIGKYAENKPFTTHTLELQKGDTIYIFTDGFADQFGGEAGKKFKSANFKKLLLSIQDKTMEEQQLIITETFNTWKGETEQVDDVCVIGVRV
jgi:serine phosphatase RsbU (regulator of sigma subunit)